MSLLFSKTARQASLRSGSRMLLPAAATHHRFMSVIILSDEQAVEKFRMVNHKSVLYFTATWCPPCKAIAPIYEELAKKYPAVGFGKVDVDDNNDTALDFEISSIPTFVTFDGETVKSKFSGADPSKLEQNIKALLE